jgi:hypothetical protein
METTEAQQSPASGPAPESAEDREKEAPEEQEEERGSTAPKARRGRAEEEYEAPAWSRESARPGRTVGVGSGAAALVAGGLGLASVTGTWLATLLLDREQLIGQIKSTSKSTAAQIAADYGHPWHTYALVNGVFAIAAVLTAVAVLVFTSNWLAVTRPSPWVRAVAWAGLALGVIGLLISGAMVFDVFAGLPAVASSSG